MIASQQYHEGWCFTPPKTPTHRTEGVPAEKDLRVSWCDGACATMDSPDSSGVSVVFRAAPLWAHVFGERRGLICVFSGLRPVVGDKRLVEARSAYFAYPDEMRRAVEWPRKAAMRGREVYFCGHLLKEKQRVKENAAPLVASYVDGDGARVPPAIPAPTAIVQSSPGHEQFYWGLTEPVTPEFGEHLNHRLALALGGDKSGWDCTQLLRLPGTRNHKYADAPMVCLLELRDERYNPMKLDRLLPPVSQVEIKWRAPRLRRPKDVGPAPDLSRLSQRVQNLIRHGNHGEYPSRSEADMAICVAMFAAGYDVGEVWTVMTDPTNAISEKFFEKGRHGERYLELTISKARVFGKSRRRRIRVKPPKSDAAARRKVVIRFG